MNPESGTTNPHENDVPSPHHTRRPLIRHPRHGRRRHRRHKSPEPSHHHRWDEYKVAENGVGVMHERQQRAGMRAGQGLQRDEFPSGRFRPAFRSILQVAEPTGRVGLHASLVDPRLTNMERVPERSSSSMHAAFPRTWNRSKESSTVIGRWLREAPLHARRLSSQSW